VGAKVYPLKDAHPDECEVEQWVYQRLAGALTCGAGQTACDSSLRTSLLSRVLDEIPPPGTRTVRATTGAWREVMPGVTIKLLRVDRETSNMTAFVRMERGAVYVAHQHSQSEECLVIEGEILIGSHCLHAGDMHVASAGSEHATVTSPRGALLLVRGQS
jgi:anti-sigma factor ChrR (cupin superfamily)